MPNEKDSYFVKYLKFKIILHMNSEIELNKLCKFNNQLKENKNLKNKNIWKGE